MKRSFKDFTLYELYNNFSDFFLVKNNYFYKLYIMVIFYFFNVRFVHVHVKNNDF